MVTKKLMVVASGLVLGASILLAQEKTNSEIVVTAARVTR